MICREDFVRNMESLLAVKEESLTGNGIHDMVVSFSGDDRMSHSFSDTTDPQSKAATLLVTAADKKTDAIIFVSQFKVVDPETKEEVPAIGVFGYTEKTTIPIIKTYNKRGSIVRFNHITMEEIYETDSAFCNPFKRLKQLN